MVGSPPNVTASESDANPSRTSGQRRAAIISDANVFRYDNDVLSADKGAALRAAFNVEMDRLYAIMNEGKEPDLGD
jgi:hypothetical protein